MTKTELEKQTMEWKNNYILKLEAENAELKEENLYYKDIVETNTAEWEEQGQRVVALEEENAELKEQISTKDILIKELQEQKVYWKESSSDWRHKFFKLDKVKRLIKKDKQLTKVTEIIKKLYTVYYDPCVTESDLKYRDELFAEIKQFISEVEK